MSKLFISLDLKATGPLRYEPTSRPHSVVSRNVFGGAILYQLLLAGFKSLPIEDSRCMTFSCNFVDRVDSVDPLYYEVEVLRDGKTFFHRLIRCVQYGKTRAIAHATFVTLRPQFPRSGPQPVVQPDNIPNRGIQDDRFNPFARFGNKFTVKALTDTDLFEPTSNQGFAKLDVVDVMVHQKTKKGLTWIEKGTSLFKEEYTMRDIMDHQTYSWSRVKRNGSDYSVEPPYFDQLYQAFVLDQSIVYSVAELLGRPYNMEKYKLSLDHDIHFDQPFKTSDPYDWAFNLVQLRKGRDGRFLITQDIFSESGECAASCSQQAACVLDERQPKL